MLDTSKGFTRPGVERLNDSIRTYVWAQTRTTILGTGTAFDAQKQFLANVEDAISSPVDLPSAISRYQDVLRYAGSKVDFVFGIGLYMAPSDMELVVGTIEGYNNEIVVPGPGQILGVNAHVNLLSPGPVRVKSTLLAALLGQQAQQQETPGTYSTGSSSSVGSKRLMEFHDEEITALIVGGVSRTRLI